MVSEHIHDPEDPRYIPNELLLTFTSGTSTPDPDDPRVRRLLQKAEAIADEGSLHGFTRHEQMLDLCAEVPELWEQVIKLQEELRQLREQAPEREGQAGELRKRVHELWERVRRLREPAVGNLEQAAQSQQQDGEKPAPPLTVPLHLPPQHPPFEGRDNVKVAVDRINSNLAELYDGGVAVSSAMPNWIMSSTAGVPHAGPGTLPAPAPDGTWTFTGVPDVGKWPDGREVIVAVLDTWPGKESIEKALARYGAGGYESGRYLQSLVSAVGGGDVWEPPGVGPLVPPRLTYTYADHGLFVAGIIHSIAPQATIQPLRVFDAYGLGSTDRLLQALDHCLTLAHSGKPLVVNLSLYLLIPPDDAPLSLWDIWFHKDLDYGKRTPQENAALLEKLDERVEQAIMLLIDANAMVVASAGNDALSYGHVQPRIPADYDTAFCVVATNNQDRIAAYSNRADTPFTGNCVATWGGQGKLQYEPDRTGIAVLPPMMGNGLRDGIVGLYSGPDMLKPNDNDTGWAYWSGTSFAAPIISGIAANLLAEQPELTPRGIMSEVLRRATLTADPALGCPCLPIHQKQR